MLKSICGEEVRFRELLRVGFVEQGELIDALKEQFSELLSVFAERANCENAIRRIAERFVSTRRRLLSGQLCELQNVRELEGGGTLGSKSGRASARDRRRSTMPSIDSITERRFSFLTMRKPPCASSSAA